MKWERLGHIYCAQNSNELMRTYARMPTPLHLEGDIFRVYFESRNQGNTAYPYFLDLEISDRPRIVNIHDYPILSYGSPGMFDDNGITPFSAHKVGDKTRLYYAGWNRCFNVPFRNAIGLAESDDGGITFSKVSAGPILGQDRFDPIFPTGPFVLYDEGVWKMWYTSFEEWRDVKGELRHYYNIKCRHSADGINWNCRPLESIKFNNEYEYAFVCRSVMKSKSIYRMWYCFRGQPDVPTYRIGYAESEDSVSWLRMDHKMRHFDVARGEWDSEMVCYPAVFQHKGVNYMLYNGNGYGQTGFGLAYSDG